jgi:uncharacterized protein YaiE (UPF0345 family)
MFKTNEYFDGKVKSIAFQTDKAPATIGVMANGDYEFGTSTEELMTVISGILHVALPGETQMKKYTAGESFRVPKDVKFRVKAEGDTSYLCLYL